jgi:hypothetical protein
MDRFRGNGGTPTHDQFAMLGRIVSSLSVLDKVIQSIIGRLSGASVYLSSAASDGLSFSGKLEAMKKLAEIHRQQMSILEPGLIDRITEFRVSLEDAVRTRNQLAHWVWFRSDDDEMVGFQAKPSSAQSKVLSMSELDRIAIRFEELIGEGIDLDDVIAPSVDLIREAAS